MKMESGLSGTLLVVDDEELNLDMLSRRLKSRGYSVRTAGSGKAALEALEGVDMVLLDVSMPEMDGFEVLRAIRRQRGKLELPVLMVTARTDSQDIIEALEIGANDYITKPIDLPVALARIKTHLSLREASAQNDRFLGTVAHDLRSPLGSISTCADYLADELERLGSERGRRPCERLRSRLEAVRKLVDGLLDLSAIRQGRFQIETKRMDPMEVLRSTHEEGLLLAAKKGIELHLECPQFLPPILADAERLGQILGNLISNGVAYSNPGTEMWLSAAQLTPMLEFTVRDQGAGLSAEEQSRLFKEPGSAGAAPADGKPGLGLGLAITKRLVEAQHGTLRVQS
ncbi:MAG: response regulator, partial [Candidatus Riflebacteria bacterium]|nr:response regulator [Candidatus Riflebacteria bacterium]